MNKSFVKIAPLLFIIAELTTLLYPRALSMLPRELYQLFCAIQAIWILYVAMNWRYTKFAPVKFRFPGVMWAVSLFFIWSTGIEIIIVWQVGGLEAYQTAGTKYTIGSSWLLRFEALGNIAFFGYYLYAHLLHHLDILFRVGYWLGKINKSLGHAWNIMVKSLAGIKISIREHQLQTKYHDDLRIAEPTWLYVALVYARENHLPKRALVLMTVPQQKEFSIQWKPDGTILLVLPKERDYFLRKRDDRDAHEALLKSSVERGFSLLTTE